jgi:hypothetical protein
MCYEKQIPKFFISVFQKWLSRGNINFQESDFQARVGCVFVFQNVSRKN